MRGGMPVMTDRDEVSDSRAEIDQALDDLVCEVSAKLEAGEPVDLEQIAVEHPRHVDRLRKLIPTLRAMAELRHSDSAWPVTSARLGPSISCMA